MNHIYQPHEDMLLFRLSDNAEYHKREEGLFEVRYNGFASRTFSTMVSAFLFYLRLDESASLWDVTEEEVLVERKISLLNISRVATAHRRENLLQMERN